MKRLILGTAGHVDHGKTALVKALTGFDCDTHKEEKARGITINLGFTHLDLPSGTSFGVVDVPGHRDFVHTMVSGAMGIDVGMLVVAADSGVMPQTREHLQIMDVLGIRAGLVALNKIDLVDPEIAELAEDELAQLLEGTFLAGCPIVRVSSVTGEGLPSLLATLEKVAASVSERSSGRVFRLFPDRVFSVAGFGTVVTGSVLGGTLSRGGTAMLLPEGRRLRVRRLERHGAEVESVYAGDRASINLVGLERDEVKRGTIICDRVLMPSTLVDAKVRLFSDARPLGRWTQAVLHLGTYEHQVRVHLLDRDQLAPGSEGLAQLHLEVPSVVQAGDRFVLRRSSSDITLGGGEVLDPTPLHHRRHTEAMTRALTVLADGRFPELVAAEIRKQRRPVDFAALAPRLNVAVEDLESLDLGALPRDIVILGDAGRHILIAKETHARIREGVLAALGRYHRENPLTERGRTVEELMGAVGIEPGGVAEAGFRLLIASLEADQRIKAVERTYALFKHRVDMGGERKRQSAFVEDYLTGMGMSTPILVELKAAAAKEGIKPTEVDQALRYLVEQKRAHYIDGEYLSAAVVAPCRKVLIEALDRGGAGLTVAAFRDLVKGNRRICLLMYALFDREGLTCREGDTRVLTEKGKALARRGSC